MNASHWTLNATGIMVALVVGILVANPAAAEPNTGNRSPTFRERIDAARDGCTKSGGTFKMTIEVSQGRAHTDCGEKDGSSTTCTITMSSSICENKPAESSTGPGTGRLGRDIPNVGAEITQADRQWAAPVEAYPAVRQNLTKVETDDAGATSPILGEDELAPLAPVEEVPIVVEETEDEEA